MNPSTVQQLRNSSRVSSSNNNNNQYQHHQKFHVKSLGTGALSPPPSKTKTTSIKKPSSTASTTIRSAPDCKFASSMVASISQSDLFEQVSRSLNFFRRRLPVGQRGNKHIFDCSELRKQVVVLKNETDLSVPKGRQVFVIE